MEKLKEYISPIAIIFIFIVLILVLIRSKFDDKEKIPVISYDFLNSFAGYRSETFDIIAEEKDERLNRRTPKVKKAKDFIAFNFDYEHIRKEGSQFPEYNFFTKSNLEKLNNPEFQKKMKIYRVQVRAIINDKKIYYGSEKPVYVINEDGGGQSMENPDEVINTTSGALFFGRNPASANNL